MGGSHRLEQDRVNPVEMGLRLSRAASAKQIELFPEATHDDLFDHGHHFWLAWRADVF